MPLIQITNTYSGPVLDIVKSEVPDGFKIRLLKENTKEALLECVSEADYILASGRVPIDGEILSRASKLKMIQRTGVGLDSLDLRELKERNIPLYVNQGVNSDSVAEHTLLLILACLRKLSIINQNTKNGIWKKQIQGVQTRELSHQIVGIIGMGNIGQRVAKLLEAFGTEVVYYDAFKLSEEQEKELGAQYVSLDVLFEMADIVTLHCPLTPETKEIICADSLNKMKDGVILINTARGGLINEEALLQMLKNGKVAFAGLDVFASEPTQNKELLIQENLIATPHIGGVTYDSFAQMMHDAMRNIRLFEEEKQSEIEDRKYLF